MNYLAHVFLAGPRVTDQVGGLLGDFVKGPLPAGLPPDLAAGVELHRFIDSFTDRHPIFRQSQQRLSASCRRFSGIMIDLLYDHFLARHWSHFSDVPLLRFTHDFYAALDQFQPWLPDALRTIQGRMRERNWLAAYAELSVVGRALDQIGQHRLRRPNPLVGSLQELESHYADLERDFWTFMPDIQRQSALWRQRHPTVSWPV